MGVLGMIDSLYIYHKNNQPEPMSCPLHSDCTAVLKSKWNKFLGVKNEVWGFLYFLLIFSLNLFYIFDLFYFVYYDYVLFGIIIFGFAYSLFLTGVQIFKIKEYCLYCLVSAGVNLLMFGVILWFYIK